MWKGCVSVLFKYCSSVFYHRLHLIKHQRILERVERLVNINVARLYRTVPYIVSSVISGMAPLRFEIVTRSIRWMVDSGIKVTEWFDVVPFKAVLRKKRYRRGERILSVSELRVESNALPIAQWQGLYDPRASEARDESSVQVV